MSELYNTPQNPPSYATTGNPPVLPWHREAADCATAAYDRLREDKGCRIIDDIAAIIARHDPVQHAETVELLQAAAFEVHNIPLATQIRAHLDKLKGLT